MERTVFVHSVMHVLKLETSQSASNLNSPELSRVVELLSYIPFGRGSDAVNAGPMHTPNLLNTRICLYDEYENRIE